MAPRALLIGCFWSLGDYGRSRVSVKKLKQLFVTDQFPVFIPIQNTLFRKSLFFLGTPFFGERSGSRIWDLEWEWIFEVMRHSPFIPSSKQKMNSGTRFSCLKIDVKYITEVSQHFFCLDLKRPLNRLKQKRALMTHKIWPIINRIWSTYVNDRASIPLRPKWSL